MRLSRIPLIGIISARCLIAGMCVSNNAHAVDHSLNELQVLSSRADAISGGSALVKLAAPVSSGWTVTLDSVDVTSAFHETQEGSGVRLALLADLAPGQHSLEVHAGSEVKSKLELVDHSLSGPLFSGPHQQPFVCQTVANGLGPTHDENCDTETVVQYYYKPLRSESPELVSQMVRSLEVFEGAAPVDFPPGFKAYYPDHPPSDVAMTTTSEGRTVPYIVRREIGVINRAVYDIRFLQQPNDPLPNPWSSHHDSWNGRLVYVFGGGCGASYRQGTLLAATSHESLLADGYAVATSTLNIFGNSCNDVVSAETLSMVKEHFIKTFGAPVHTMGWGDSGGAMQQYLVAQNYPGLLDGIIPVISFPDLVTYLPESTDCPLLLEAFDGMKGPLTDVQKSAVTGFATWRTCIGYSGPVNATECAAAIPSSQVYDRHERPKGIRCDVFENEVNVFGRDPGSGFAMRPLDNVGVQYGLAALRSGRLTPDEFIELNEHVGGYDHDGRLVSQRTRANDASIRRAYENGLVLTGGGGLRDTAIIDWRWYSDDLAEGHDSMWSFVTRARLTAANDSAANQVIMIDTRASVLRQMVLDLEAEPDDSRLLVRRERELVLELDRWLDKVSNDSRPGTMAQKIARDKPAVLADTCWMTDGEKISGSGVFGPKGRCKTLYPQYGDPRIAAGEPITNDVLKCNLKPVSAADYPGTLSPAQLQRLRATFPNGVCDYTRHGLGEMTTSTTWRHFSGEGVFDSPTHPTVSALAGSRH